MKELRGFDGSNLEHESRRQMEMYPFANEAGEAICSLRVATVDEAVRRVDEVQIIDEHGNEHDLFELLQVPEGVKVEIDRQPPECNIADQRVFINGIESAYRFSTLVHELEHTKQGSNPRLKPILPLYKAARANPYRVNATALLVEIMGLIEVPDPGIPDDVLQELIDLGIRYQAYKIEAADAEEKGLEEKQRKLEKLQVNLAGEYKRFAGEYGDKIERLLALPAIVVERDAEDGVVRQFERLRTETGISFDQATPFLEVDREDADAVGSTLWGDDLERWKSDCASAQTIQDMRIASLRTHKADDETVNAWFGGPPKLK